MQVGRGGGGAEVMGAEWTNMGKVMELSEGGGRLG